MTALASFLEASLLDARFDPPLENETEPEYTARVITPFIQKVVASKTKARGIWVKGDGTSRQAFARTFMGLRFHPDVAVGQNDEKHWCAEVKLVRNALIGDVLTKAIGQALMYREGYNSVTIVLLVNKSSNKKLEHGMHAFNSWLNVLVISEFGSKWP